MSEGLLERIAVTAGGYITKFGVGRLLVIAVVLIAFAVGLVHGGYVIVRGIYRLSRSGGDRAVAAMALLQSALGLGAVLIVFLVGVDTMHFPSRVGKAQTAAWEQEGADLRVLQSEEAWAELDVEEKMEVLQSLVEAQRKELGISERIIIRMEDLPDGIAGDYNDTKGLIRILPDRVENDPVRTVVNTVCHEMYHCYESRLMEVYAKAAPKNRGLKIFDDVEAYWEEENHYVKLWDDKEGYRNQKIEVNARQYAAEATERYCTPSEEAWEEEPRPAL